MSKRQDRDAWDAKIPSLYAHTPQPTKASSLLAALLSARFPPAWYTFGTVREHKPVLPVANLLFLTV
jgi:hypothetical protein